MNLNMNYPKSEWTINYLIEQLYLCLILKKEKDGFTRKYEKQAQDLMYKIPLNKPTPYYIINLSDLTLRIKKELVSLSKEMLLDQVMKETIGQIFEGINKEYYILSVRKSLKWKFEK